MNEARYEIYPMRNVIGQRRWRWRYRAANGRIVASGEAYANRADCEHAIALLQHSHLSPIRELTA